MIPLYAFNDSQRKTKKMTNNNNNGNKISYRVFNSYANRTEDFEDVRKIPRYLKRMDGMNGRDNGDNGNAGKKNALRYKDARLSYKNRRSINKDWKDFNNA